MNHHTTQSAAQASHDTARDELTAPSLRDFFPDLTDDPCERLSALLDLYIEGDCEPEVLTELDQHKASCERCATRYAQRAEWCSSFIQGVEGMQPTITVDDAEASLKDLLESRWDELGLDDLELDDLRETLVEGSEVASQGPDAERRSTIQLLDHGEPLVKRRMRRRVVSLMSTVAAAAFLFAYGPAFIETNVTESEPKFPVAQSPGHTPGQQDHTRGLGATQRAPELPRWTPLIQHIGAILPTSSFTPDAQLSLSSCVSASSGEVTPHTSVRLRYTLSLSTSPTQTFEVDLSSRSLTEGQRAHLNQRRGDAGEGAQARSAMSSLKRSKTERLQLIEYTHRDRHYQWSAALSTPAELLESLVTSHRASR